MSGCPGCLPTGKALVQLYEATRKKAVEFGKENNVSVAIYRTDEGYSYMNAEVAISQGYQIREVITCT